jgi:RNA polymerase sigma-70 factor (ECF subfamily)
MGVTRASGGSESLPLDASRTEPETSWGQPPGAARAVSVGARSFEAFYAWAARRMVTQLFMVTGDLEEARDCVQEAFARAWLRWDVLSSDGSDPFAWVNTVGYRIAVSRFRRRMVHSRALRRLSPPESIEEPTAEVIAVRNALATLPHGQRAALVLHYFVGLPVDAVARTLGISPGGVKSRLSRGRAALAPLLSEEATR